METQPFQNPEPQLVQASQNRSIPATGSEHDTQWSKPSIVIVDQSEPSPSNENAVPLSALSPGSQTLLVRDSQTRRRGRPRTIEQEGKSESSNSPESYESVLDNGKQHNSTPDSGLLNSSPRRKTQYHSDDEFNDQVSIYTTIDGGYTAAEQTHKPISTERDDAARLLAGVGAHSESSSTLESRIRASLQVYGGGKHEQAEDGLWLPFDRLFQVINQGSVYQELSDAYGNGVAPEKLKEYAGKICHSIEYRDGHGDVLKSSARSIFAILTLMDKVQNTIQFIDAGISHRDLPLGFRSDGQHLFCISQPTRTWKIASAWGGRDFDSFRNYQRYMLSPFFELRSRMYPWRSSKVIVYSELPGANLSRTARTLNDMDEWHSGDFNSSWDIQYTLPPDSEHNPRVVPFYELSDSTVLPFIEDGKKSRRRYGHHGTVWRVKIHPAHHDLCVNDDDQNPHFAVKALNSNDDNGNDFKHEVNAWAKSVGSTGHPHLIQLLATWRQKRRWHLLFPWAKCNLLDLWKDNEPKRDPSLVVWIAEQCLGIAGGLRKIHRSGSIDPTSQYHGWGIHGDVKPENILLFGESESLHGKLVICDFGFTRFHTKETRSDAKLPGYTGTYRAPEMDMQLGISRVYDIWSLGCLYLEFITWYLIGSSGVDNFTTERAREDRGEPIRMDKFFVCHSLHEENMFNATLKPSVSKWIHQLHTSQHCSQFFHDFLDIIETGMLVVDASTRHRSDTIAENLHKICLNCRSRGESYFYTGTPGSISKQSSIANDSIKFPRPVMAMENRRQSRAPSLGRLPKQTTWMVDSVSASSGTRSQDQFYNNIDTKLANTLTGETNSSLKRQLQVRRSLRQFDERWTGQANGVTEGADANVDNDDGNEDEYSPLLQHARPSRHLNDHARESFILTDSPEAIERGEYMIDLDLPIIESDDHPIQEIDHRHPVEQIEREFPKRDLVDEFSERDQTGLDGRDHPFDDSSGQHQTGVGERYPTSDIVKASSKEAGSTEPRNNHTTSVTSINSAANEPSKSLSESNTPPESSSPREKSRPHENSFLSSSWTRIVRMLRYIKDWLRYWFWCISNRRRL